MDPGLDLGPRYGEFRIPLERFVELLDQMNQLILRSLSKDRAEVFGKAQHSVVVSKQCVRRARRRLENDGFASVTASPGWASRGVLASESLSSNPVGRRVRGVRCAR